MKKVIFFGLLALVALLSIIDDSSNANEFSSSGKSNDSFGELIYSKPKKYVEEEPYDVGDDMKVLIYHLDDSDKNININMHYDIGHDYDYITDSSTEYIEKEINGTTWRLLHVTNMVARDIYYVVYNNSLYQIELNGINKKPEMEAFMDSVSFK